MTEIDALKTGGVLAFAALVLVILRELPKILKAFLAAFLDLKEQLFEIRITITAMLERDRRRSERRKRESDQPLRSYSAQHARTAPPKGEFDAEEGTDIHALIELQREKALEAEKAKKSRGERKASRGTHHDEQD